jgi:hypothetical protein
MTDEPAMTDDPVVGEAPSTRTLQEQLRAARADAQHRQNEDFPIPGYGGRLCGTFKALDDYSEVRQIIASNAKITDPAQQELYIAADTITRACVTVYALEGETRHPLEMGIGAQLAAYLGEEVENDRQGVFAIFPSTVAVMGFFADLDKWIKQAGETSDRQVTEGNSVAPSS